MEINDGDHFSVNIFVHKFLKSSIIVLLKNSLKLNEKKANDDEKLVNGKQSF